MTYVPVQPECRDRDKMLLYKWAINVAAYAESIGATVSNNIYPNMTETTLLQNIAQNLTQAAVVLGMENPVPVTSTRENALLSQIACLTYYIANNACNCAPVGTSYLLQEDGSYLLQEDGSRIII